ncbi:MAG TPA: energy transducer TonB, partial [Rhizomicrobium sp.]|nr:energy transducer TonB [Rhizomicrobium sp.]
MKPAEQDVDSASVPAGVTPPQSLGAHICPGYPEREAILEQAGKSLLGFTVTTQGAVADIKVEKSSGFQK